ncbi:GIY-YIG nuclease family protein [Clostridium sp. AM58-1XD]|uniref:GIY-YIG nuclease family protein n=1 Tax=Clostridium sp. AM58-1XD TaxID=2292307 RepID=UPI000E557109|nr:GIY-YIG nuclease family protein [Clostridium sp. AM58-1XD]RGY99269.1 GIY-YIG nuclease family protein [Clostridium sp. AM58-1XD]
MNYTYLVECADKSLYCGWTNHLEQRIRAHNDGKGAKYTKCRRPVRLVYMEVFETKEEAMRREAAIKKMSRRQKEQLIKERPVGENKKALAAEKE